jgi:hypothetical protein
LLNSEYLGCIGRAGPLGNTSRLVALPGGRQSGRHADEHTAQLRQGHGW